MLSLQNEAFDDPSIGVIVVGIMCILRANKAVLYLVGIGATSQANQENSSVHDL